MKTLSLIAMVALGVAGLAAVSRRLATHQAMLPGVSKRINTRVIRINQHGSMPPRRGTGSLPEPQGDELP